jgi:hypothetical protein
MTDVGTHVRIALAPGCRPKALYKTARATDPIIAVRTAGAAVSLAASQTSGRAATACLAPGTVDKMQDPGQGPSVPEYATPPSPPPLAVEEA